MSSKTFSLMLTSILTLVVLAGFASAVDLDPINSTQAVIPANVSHSAGSFQITFNLSNTGAAGTLDYTSSVITSGTATIAAFNDNSIAIGTAASPTIETITATITFGAHQSGNIAGTIDVLGQSSTTHRTLAFSVPILSSSTLDVSDATLSASSNSTTFIVKNTGNTVLSNIVLTATGDFSVALSTSTIASLAAGATQTITLNATSDLEDKIGGTIRVTATSGTVNDTGTITRASQYCEYGNYGNDGKLEVKLTLDHVSGFGTDDEWFAFDEIEAEFEVSNEGDTDLDDVTIEWGLYDTTSKTWYIQEEENDFNLNEDKDKTLTVTFKLDEDIDTLKDADFVFYVRATGVVDENGNAKDGLKVCAEDSESTMEVKGSEEFILLRNVVVPEVSQCGAEIALTADLWNIGEDDQSDVYVTLYNRELNLNKKIIAGDIDAFDKQGLDATFTLPTGIAEKTYQITATIFNEDGDEFTLEKDGDDESAIFTIPLKVEGSCVKTSNAAVSASLQSGGKAGDDLVIKTTITNTGASQATYTLNAAGYAEWATQAKFAESTITLASGASKEVSLTLSTKDGVSGEKTFDVEIVSGNQVVLKQPVAVSLESSAGFLSGITSKLTGSSWYLWAIGALNIILVVVIIVVALKVAKN